MIIRTRIWARLKLFIIFIIFPSTLWFLYLISTDNLQNSENVHFFITCHIGNSYPDCTSTAYQNEQDVHKNIAGSGDTRLHFISMTSTSKDIKLAY